MVNEKTHALYANKMTFDNEQKTGNFCFRNIIPWSLAVSMVVLLVILVQFLYPTVVPKINPDDPMFDTQAIEVKIISPVNSDYSSSKDKEQTIMNPWDLEFLIDPPELCATRNPPNSHQYQLDPEVKLLMLVPSAVHHFKQRRAIRNTWGSIAEKPLGPMRLGFVLGTTENRTVNYLIQGESLIHKDIIQANFVDSYYNLTTKSVLMLKWVAKRCPHAQYFLKAHDDTFVNVDTVTSILDEEPFVSGKKFIGGYVRFGARPSRIPQEDYPDNEYPPYTLGAAYMMPGPTASELFHASKEVNPFLQQEDLYLTGLCAEKIGAPRIHDSRFVYNDPPFPPTWNAYSSLATAHSVVSDTFQVVWDDKIKSAGSRMSHFSDQEFAINSTMLLRKKRNLQKLLRHGYTS